MVQALRVASLYRSTDAALLSDAIVRDASEGRGPILAFCGADATRCVPAHITTS